MSVHYKENMCVHVCGVHTYVQMCVCVCMCVACVFVCACVWCVISSQYTHVLTKLDRVSYPLHSVCSSAVVRDDVIIRRSYHSCRYIEVTGDAWDHVTHHVIGGHTM